MSDAVSVELSANDKKLLLRGLRYVRSAILLEVRDPEDADEAKRAEELKNIEAIVERLNSATAGV